MTKKAFAAQSEVEHANLADLVQHRRMVPSRFTIGEVYTRFQSQPENYTAVVADQKLVGICAREAINSLLHGCRYGFALYGQNPVTECLLEEPLRIVRGTPLLEVLDHALSRNGKAFYEDAALVDGDGVFLGMISTRALVRLQSALLAEKIRLLKDSPVGGIEMPFDLVEG